MSDDLIPRTLANWARPRNDGDLADVLLDLAKLCRKFIVRDLASEALCLRRSGVPADEIVRQLPMKAERTSAATRKLKWRAGLGVVEEVRYYEADWLDQVWKQVVEEDIPDFIEDFAPQLAHPQSAQMPRPNVGLIEAQEADAERWRDLRKSFARGSAAVAAARRQVAQRLASRVEKARQRLGISERKAIENMLRMDDVTAWESTSPQARKRMIDAASKKLQRFRRNGHS